MHEPGAESFKRPVQLPCASSWKPWSGRARSLTGGRPVSGKSEWRSRLESRFRPPCTPDHPITAKLLGFSIEQIPLGTRKMAASARQRR